MERNLSDKSRFSRVGLCYFTLMLVTQALQMLAMALLYDRLANTTWGLWAISYVPLYGIAVPVFLWMMKKLVPDAPGRFGTQTLSAGGWVRWVFLSLGATYLLNLVSTLLTSLLAMLKGGAVQNPLAMMQEGSSPLMMLLFAGILAPVGEEYLFRKLLWDKLGGYGERMYLLMGGFVFALFHANLSQLLYAFVLGAAFCYIYARTGRLRYTIALHITINIFGSVLMPMLALSGSETAVMATGVLVIALVIVGVILAARGRWKFPPEPQQADAAGQTANGETGSLMPQEAAPEQKASAPTFGRALLAPGMLAYTALCVALILIVTFIA